ncbi:MAG TPA: site-specific integrase, partial [Euryarchaeota archaeon]|nr:site-specific integrase [Euryarchaeota archaeon]
VIIEENKVYVNTKCKVPKSAKIQRVTTPLLNREVVKMMKLYIERLDKKGIKQDEYIFANRLPRSAYSAYRQTIERVCKKAGIKYKSPHKAKHGFITKMAQNGMSAEQICKMTGNLTPRLIQEVYMHLQLKGIEEKVEELVNE